LKLRQYYIVFWCLLCLNLTGCDFSKETGKNARIRVVDIASGKVILNELVSPMDGSYAVSTHSTAIYPAIAATSNGEVKYVHEASFPSAIELSFAAIGRDSAGNILPHTNSSLAHALSGESNVEFTLTYNLSIASSYKEFEIDEGASVKRPVVERIAGVDTVFVTPGVVNEHVLPGRQYIIQISVADYAKAP
tara:strand:- start:1266 stop:1841 length:576 start_codon:yes stop_codon:yes gene_type:complete